MRLLGAKKFDEARTQLQSLLAKRPSDGTLHTLMGRVEVSLGDIQTALDEFAKAISLVPKDAEAHTWYAIALIEAKRPTNALSEIKIAKELDPGTSGGLVATLLYADSQYPDAAAAARSELAKDPKDDLSLEVITGVDYRSNPGGDLWRQDAARLAGVDKNAIWVLVAHAFDEFKANHRETGIDALQAAKKDGFPDSLPYVLLSQIYVSDVKLEQAESEVSAGLANFPTDSLLLRTGVFVALANHDRRKADDRLSELRRLAANTPEEAFVSCLYYYSTNQAPLAMSACERSVSGNPTLPVAYSNYGWAALDASQFDLALKQFSKAVLLYKGQKPTAVQAIDLGWGMIIAQYYSGDRKSAIELFQQLEKEYPYAATAAGVQRLPLVWSETTLTRIQFIERDVHK